MARKRFYPLYCREFVFQAERIRHKHRMEAQKYRIETLIEIETQVLPLDRVMELIAQGVNVTSLTCVEALRSSWMERASAKSHYSDLFRSILCALIEHEITALDARSNFP
jgi:FixJ family two-component response regulator